MLSNLKCTAGSLDRSLCTYPPLAAVAMDAVERWQKSFPQKLQEWLPEIVPCLNDYLVDFEDTELADSDMLEDPTGGSTSAPSIGNVSRAQLARIKQRRAKEAQVKLT